MHQTQSKTATQANLIPLAGPAFVFFSILLLVIKQSPFYIDLSILAFTGTVLAWRFKWKGFISATLLLLAVLAYDVYAEHVLLSFWEVGVILSIIMAYFVTSLTSIEFLNSLFEVRDETNTKISTLEELAATAQAVKMELETKISSLEERLATAGTEIKAKEEKAEMWERLVNLARDETKTQLQLRENLEKKVQESSKKNAELDFALKEVNTQFATLQKTYEEAQIQKKQKDEKIQGLTEQLTELTDRLKGLQSEKDKLEQALDEALKQPDLKTEEITTSKVYKQLNGLYQQLRIQFQEKSNSLDIARKDLFLAQENLAKWQKEQQEAHEFEPIFKAYEEQIAKLQSDLHSKEEEVVLYEQLVNALTQPP